jgi:hypothetical protein
MKRFISTIAIGLLLSVGACSSDRDSESDRDRSSDRGGERDGEADSGRRGDGSERDDAGEPGMLGTYSCFMWIGPVTTGHLSRVPGFTLTDGEYDHENGGGGTTRLVGDAIEFSGGPLNDQAGRVAPNSIHLYNRDRSMTVIDCSK